MEFLTEAGPLLVDHDKYPESKFSYISEFDVDEIIFVFTIDDNDWPSEYHYRLHYNIIDKVAGDMDALIDEVKKDRDRIEELRLAKALKEKQEKADREAQAIKIREEREYAEYLRLKAKFELE